MPRTDERGFTLLEAVVAFAIASLALAALMEVYASSASSSRRAVKTLAAVELAEARLAALEEAGPLSPGTIGPGLERGLAWQIDVERANDDVAPATATLFQVTVTVSDPEDARPILRLATVRRARQGDAQGAE